MVNDTNGEQAAPGEASSSRRKRQRLPSITEDDAEVERMSGTLFDLDLLECPVCCDALTSPIFQCDNGHIACSSCCTKLRNKCPSCTLPIGNYRCRIMERVVEAIIVPCPNAKHGCTEKFSYDKVSAHEKECSFALCYCPAPNCNYSGVYKDLYSHYYANHKDIYKRFRYGYGHDNIYLEELLNNEIVVLQEYFGGPVVVVQCFKKPRLMYVTVNCIAPPAPGVGKFSYCLSYSIGGKTILLESPEMNMIQKVSFQTPEDVMLVVPCEFLDRQPLSSQLRINICIRRVKEEEEEAKEEEADEG